MKLETERLILRKPKESDWKDIAEGCNNLEVSKHVLLMPHPYGENDAKEWIEIATKKWDEGSYEFFIELKSEKKVIGGLGLKVDENDKIGETGFWINQKYWRKGYITEALKALFDFAFDKLKLRKIESGAFAENEASNAIHKKMGYVLEGMKRKHGICKATGEIHDENIYGLLKEEWKK